MELEVKGGAMMGLMNYKSFAMKPVFTFRNVTAFLSASFLLHELHELVHTSVGRILCGSWGTRDFNVWSLNKDCDGETIIQVASTLAGPAFTFLMLWVGFYFMHGKTIERKSLGMVLVFASAPFQRLLNALFGIGDEIWAMTSMGMNHSVAWVLVIVLVLLIIGAPNYKAYNLIQENRRMLWFCILFLGPTIIDLLVIEGLLNFLLIKVKLLSDYWIMGSPMLVTAWTIFVSLTFVFTRKSMSDFFR